MILHFLITSVQLIVYLLAKLYLVFSGSTITVSLSKKIEFSPGLLFIANHSSKADLFLLFTALPIKHFFSILPIYGVIAPSYMNTNWKRIALTLFGCFSTGKTKLETLKALHFLFIKVKTENTILLFPEGKRQNTKKGQAKLGVGALRKKFPKRKFVPTYVQINKQRGRFWLPAYQATILFDDPLKNDQSKEANFLAKEALKKIYQIPVHHENFFRSDSRQ